MISIEEFAEQMEDYGKTTLTWYAGDSSLCENRTPIRDVAGTVGMEFMHHFGWKSESDHVVYVRNTYLEHDFEIVLNEGSYASEVLNYGRPS